MMNGNVTATGGKTFSYDSENHLISMTASGTSARVYYDPLGTPGSPSERSSRGGSAWPRRFRRLVEPRALTSRKPPARQDACVEWKL